MGYESRIYIVIKGSLEGFTPETEDMVYGQIVAVYDLCKMGYSGPFLDLMNKSPKTECYIYADDGDTLILEDKYGAPLSEMPIKDLLTALEAEDQDYRRIPPLIAMLKSIVNDPSWGTIDKLVALHYGY